MNIRQKIITICGAGMVMGAMALDFCEVTGVKARQRYPWNGLVDIDFTLDSNPTEPYLMNVIAFDNIGKTNLPVKTCYTEGISFCDNPCMVRTDTRRILWDAAADLPAGFKATNVLVSCQDVRTMGISNLYMIVNLETGVNSDRYPITYTNCPPPGGWTEDYKTTKLVLRRVEPGTFIMGSHQYNETGHQENETQHKVTLTKPFYIGVFEVTARQYALVSGGSGTDTQPITIDIGAVRGFDLTATPQTISMREGVDFGCVLDVIQKTEKLYSWPSSDEVDPGSFMGRLRTRTALRFDLPTEAQWEYACRAGSSLPLNIGRDTDFTDLIAGDKKLDESATHYVYVGNYMPNAFGLYDMQGNVAEWCLDAYQEDLGSGDVVDPVGPEPELVLYNLTGTGDSKGYGPATVSFGGQTQEFYSHPSILCKYTGFKTTRVVRGGSNRAAARSSCQSANNQGEIFTIGARCEGVSIVKLSLSNPVHGVRVVVNVEE